MNFNEVVIFFIYDNVNNIKIKYLEEWIRFIKKYLYLKWEFVNFFNDENIFWKILFRNVFFELFKMVFIIFIIVLCFFVDFDVKKIKFCNIFLFFEFEYVCKLFGFLIY